MHFANMLKVPRKPWYLKEWRKVRGFTQDRLAEVTELSKPYISQLERGGRQYNQELLELFAQALNTTPADLINRRPNDPEGVQGVAGISTEGLSKEQRALLHGMVEQMRKAG